MKILDVGPEEPHLADGELELGELLERLGAGRLDGDGVLAVLGDLDVADGRAEGVEEEVPLGLVVAAQVVGVRVLGLPLEGLQVRLHGGGRAGRGNPE